jgi:hypothetical protein
VTRRSRALATGLAIVAAYATLAAISGRLTPIARRPLLDGLTPISYRWVSPPPELASTNVLPASGSFTLAVWPGHSQGMVFSTDDAQLTLIVPKDAIPYADEQRSVDVSIEPFDPAKLAAPEPPLILVGNAYRVTAAYRPSGDRLKGPLAKQIEVVLVYPALPNVHGGHTLISSRDGNAWTEVTTNDLVSVGQADAQIGALGYLAVAATGARTPTPMIPGSNQGESFPVAIVIVGVALVVLIGGLALGIRNSRATRPR